MEYHSQGHVELDEEITDYLHRITIALEEISMVVRQWDRPPPPIPRVTDEEYARAEEAEQRKRDAREGFE